MKTFKPFTKQDYKNYVASVCRNSGAETKFGVLYVQSVEQVKGKSPLVPTYTAKGGSPYVNNYTEYIALKIRGVIDGKPVSFFSPSIAVRCADGFINYKHIDPNPWFIEIKGETIGHKGAEIFDGGVGPNVAIESKSTILPAIKEGDQLNVSYKVKQELPAVTYINYVRIKK